jgi:DNA replication protein DnaC
MQDCSDPPKVGTIFPKLVEKSPEEWAAQDARSKQRSADAERNKRDAMWQLLLSDVGTRYRTADFSTWEFTDERQQKVVAAAREYAAEIAKQIEAGRNAIIFGQPGTGKDHLMVSLMRAAVLDAGVSVKWVNGMDLYGDWRDGISSEKSERELVSSLSGAAVLAVSDPLPPSGPLTAYQQSMLFRVIDRRYRNAKPTWMTLNVANAAEAIERLGAAVVDRLREGALKLWCNWSSYREREL